MYHFSINTAEQYLNQLANRVPGKFYEFANLPNTPVGRAKVTVRPLLGSGMLLKSKSPEEEFTWHILVAEPGFERDRNNNLSEAELAEMEYTCMHEIVHMIHMVNNKQLDNRLQREKEILETLPEGKRTLDYERLLVAFETVVDYGALYYIDQFQGLDVFKSRHGNNLDRDTKSLQRIYLGHVSNGIHHETIRRLLSGDLEEIMNLSGIRRRFDKLERYIAVHPEKFVLPGNN